MLSQAEHDPLSAAFLITTSRGLADETAKQLEIQLATLPRCDTAGEAIKNHSAIIITDTLPHAVKISNRIAPEHLEIMTGDPWALLPQVRHAGSIFLGGSAPEALGDYFAGTNHTLPTSGTARFSSGLSVDDFIKKSSVIYYDKQALAAVADKIALFARREGLEAHARSVTIRM
jgi:histidinol dehydrogenase